MTKKIFILLFFIGSSLLNAQQWASVGDLDKVSKQGVVDDQIISLFNIDPIGKKRKDIVKLYQAFDAHPKIEAAVIPYLQINPAAFPFIQVLCEMPDTMGKCGSVNFRLFANGESFKSTSDYQKMVDLFNAFDQYILKTAVLNSTEDKDCKDANVLASVKDNCHTVYKYEAGGRKIQLRFEFTRNKAKTGYSYVELACKQFGTK